MNKNTLPVYTCLIAFSVFCIIVSSLFVYRNTIIRKEKKIRFTIGYGLVACCAVLEWGGKLIQALGYVNNFLFAILKSFEFILVPIIGYFIGTLFFDHGKNRYFQIGVITVNTVVMIFNFFFKFIFVLDENGNYSHGSYYWIYFSLYLLSVIFCVCQGFRMMHNYGFKNLYQLVCATIFLILGVLVQTIWKIWLDFFVLSITSFIIYIFITEISNQTDSVTTLYNRKSFDVKMEELKEEAIIMLIDIDTFKQCNDKYGHSFGDKVLEEIGEKIFISFHKYGQCYRVGGDEFVVIITKELNNYKRILKEFDCNMEDMTKTIKNMPTVSYGYTIFDPNKMTPHEAFNRADREMYNNKIEKKKKAIA